MSMYGGNYKDYKHLPLRWPTEGMPSADDPRPVRVTITRYYGQGKHYWASLKEESNVLLDPEHGERECWDMPPETRGRMYDQECLSLDEAIAWIDKKAAEKFPSPHYVLKNTGRSWADYSVDLKETDHGFGVYQYQTEGD